MGLNTWIITCGLQHVVHPKKHTTYPKITRGLKHVVYHERHTVFRMTRGLQHVVYPKCHVVKRHVVLLYLGQMVIVSREASERPLRETRLFALGFRNVPH